MFKKGWEDVLEESGKMEGYPVKTVMSLDIGGKSCTTGAGQPIALDDVWSGAADASMNAAAASAAGQAGGAAGAAAAGFCRQWCWWFNRRFGGRCCQPGSHRWFVQVKCARKRKEKATGRPASGYGIGIGHRNDFQNHL